MRASRRPRRGRSLPCRRARWAGIWYRGGRWLSFTLTDSPRYPGRKRRARVEGSVKRPGNRQVFASLTGGGQRCGGCFSLSPVSFSCSRPPRSRVLARLSCETRCSDCDHLVVSGRGWGHGVGMSQYERWASPTTAGPRPDPRSLLRRSRARPAPVARVRVLVGEAKGAVKLHSKVPFRVRDVFGKTYPLPRASWYSGQAG